MNPPPILVDIEVKVSVFTNIMIILNHHTTKTNALIMYVHDFYLVHIYPKYYIALLVKYS
jgi:hypothetical protein